MRARLGNPARFRPHECVECREASATVNRSTMGFRFYSAKGEDCTSCAPYGAQDGRHFVSRPQVGVVVVFGLTADRNGLTGFPILRASQWVVDCFGSAGS